ncbi:Multi antimicrobial extrusion protein [Dillenia turbinata]|uniref:Multi antimicrobial extrusion protein n=1 Tax=Dillenia turbinata TaxID=194707 RepID=A0AAN8UY16_9MAGN
MSFMTTMRNAWGLVFTMDEAILSLTAATMPVVGLCELGNCPQTTVCGALRGSARPALGANKNLISFYGVGLPVAIFMAFLMDMGFLGLWMGLLMAQVVCALSMVFALIKTDWVAQAERAQVLIGSEGNDKMQNRDIGGFLPVKSIKRIGVLFQWMSNRDIAERNLGR